MRTAFVLRSPLQKQGTRELYVLCYSDPIENGFYNEIRSLSAFFHSGKGRNRNNEYLYTFHPDNQTDDPSQMKEWYHSGDVLHTFNNLNEFYNYIGYDRKKKRFIEK